MELKFDFLSTYWPFYVEGLKITIIFSICAVIFGIILGIALALMKLSKLRVLRGVAVSYINFVRGTPILVQIYIVYFGLFSFGINLSDSTAGIAALAINSGAYVAEIVRAGILAVDKGQTEAGRSLGLSKAQTMIYIVIPQAIKNVLPPIGNEFIVLLKETAIVGYVSLTDLTRAANQISSRTYEAFMPLIGAAVIYFVIIKILTNLLGVLERSLRKSYNR